MRAVAEHTASATSSPKVVPQRTSSDELDPASPAPPRSALVAARVAEHEAFLAAVKRAAEERSRSAAAARAAEHEQLLSSITRAAEERANRHAAEHLVSARVAEHEAILAAVKRAAEERSRTAAAARAAEHEQLLTSITRAAEERTAKRAVLANANVTNAVAAVPSARVSKSGESGRRPVDNTAPLLGAGSGAGDLLHDDDDEFTLNAVSPIADAEQVSDDITHGDTVLEQTVVDVELDRAKLKAAEVRDNTDLGLLVSCLFFSIYQRSMHRLA